jgi:O-glycosyl hydrolase
MSLNLHPASCRRSSVLLAGSLVCFGCGSAKMAEPGGASSAGSAGAPASGGASGAGLGSSGASGVGAGGALSGGSAGAGVAGASGGASGAGSASSAGASSAGAAGSAGASGGGTPAATVVKVSFGTAHQKIDGFGMATAWGSIPPDAQLDAFFSVSKGAGLSILRNRIPFREAPANNDNFMGGGNYDYTLSATGAIHKTFKLNWGNWDLSAMHALIAKLKANPDYQVPTYFSTPWTPPNNTTSRWKLGVADYVNAPEVGGYLDPAHYVDYADVLADYVLGFAANMGAPLAALSLQNEPNYKVNYESADWSAAQMHSFLGTLRTEFTYKGVFTALPNFTIVAPEDPNFKEDLILPSLADSSTASLVGIVAAHQYEFGPQNVSTYSPMPLSTSLAAGKKVWVSEWNTSAFTSSTPLATALILAGLIQADLTKASVSAYVHWWYKDLVASGGAPNKNLWGLGQFSRFVRPGASRVEVPSSVGNDLLLAAFKNAAGTELTLVAINRGSAESTFALELDSGTLGAVSSYRTSATEDLKSLGSAPSGGFFANLTVPAQSISTFVVPVSP